MAIYKIFPSKDATLYSFYPDMNTGIDSILEVKNYNINFDPVPQVTRFLIQFPQSEIDEIVNNKINGKSFNSSIKLFIAQAQGIIGETILEVFPVAESWNNGNGTYLDLPFSTNGVSWEWKDFKDGEKWNVFNSPSNTTSSFESGNSGGGLWYISPKSEILFDRRSIKDIETDITPIVDLWCSSSIDNNGLIFKWEDGVEFNNNEAIQPILQFYSIDTNTIYPPCLELKWDDSEFSPGDLPEIPDSEIFISIDTKDKYNVNSVNRFRINVRPKYPPRVFQTGSINTENYHLPETSYFAIKDLDTQDFLINFDSQFTKVSCDNKGNYFDLYMNGLEPERNYEILIKTIIDNEVVILKNKNYFKIING